MKNQLVELKTKALNKANEIKVGATAACTWAGMEYMTMMANADNTATIMNSVKSIASKICFAAAAVTAIFGFVHYAQAHSDGDGPATAKARNQIAGAIVLGVVGAVVANIGISFE